jgi:hypothetical protein
VEHGVDTAERVTDIFGVTHIADNEFNIRV